MIDCPLCQFMQTTYWLRVRVRWLLWHWRCWCHLGLHWWLTGYTGTTWCMRCGAHR